MSQRLAPSDTISVERLERAVHALAYIVMRHGEKYGPLLNKLADELDARRNAPSAVDRARKILASMTREVNQHA